MTYRLYAKYIFIIFSLFLLLVSCQSNQSGRTQKPREKRKPVLTSDNLISQNFSIYPNRDTTLKGKAGTILRIYKNTFVDKVGKLVTGIVNIELKEAFLPRDIILSGLHTTSNGQFLETGGMMYINAYANGQRVDMTENKSVGVILPNGKVKKGMKLFEGEPESSGINWKNPEQILNDKISTQKSISEQPVNSGSTGAVTKKRSESEIDAILNYVGSDTIKPQDQVVATKKNKPKKQAVAVKADDDVFLNELQKEKGTNFFEEDANSSYIFSLKKLGWANIDRLYDDPRTKEVEFITGIENKNDFDTIYITLIVNNKNIYIPGYQRKDGTFSFTHNDEETTQLPVGEKATILATAYKNGIPYYSIMPVTIFEKQKVSIRLEGITDDKLKVILNKQI